MRFIFCVVLIFFIKFGFAQRVIVFTDSLNTTPSGWKFRGVSPHDWRWYATEGINGFGGLRMKLANDSNYLATPKFRLQAGVTYTASFATRLTQTSGNRKMRLGVNTVQMLGGTTFFYDLTLPGNSYANPPFITYNPTFSVPNTGDYNLIFDYEDAGYLFTYLDNVTVEQTFAPTVSIGFPSNNSTFNEKTDVLIAVNASDLDGVVKKVEFFANTIKLGEDTLAPYTFLWKNILPKDYNLTTKATDNRGNQTVSTAINTRINFSDGTFSKYINWDFNESKSNIFDYWTLKNGEYKTRTGVASSPCLEIFSSFSGNYAASPGVFLKSGITYKLELVGDASGTKITNFYVNNSQTLGGTLIDTVKISDNDNFNITKSKFFTVTNSGVYYLIIQYPKTESFIQLKFDNIRIIGDLEAAPLSKFTKPDKNIVIAEKSNMRLIASYVSPQEKPISKMEFYANNQKIGESSQPPYDFVWENIPIGSYSLTTRPYDMDNVSAFSTPIMADSKKNEFTSSTYLGTLKNDEIRGAVIRKDGIIVLAANVGQLLNISSLNLNSSVDSTMGCVILMTTDGKNILSITRLAEKVLDIALDGDDNIFVGGINAGQNGALFKLNSNANTILWQKTFTKWVHRLDAGKEGNSVVLTSASTLINENTLTVPTTYIFDKNGVQLATFGGGSQYTPDVVIDDASKTVIMLGFKNFNTLSTLTDTQQLPVYVPVLRGKNYDGSDKYVAYDWESASTSDRWVNRSNNNMADVRTSRGTIGQDGKLYVTFEVFGGNHVLRYDPFDVMDTVKIVGGDNYFNFSNTGTETKVFVGRFEPGTGKYILGQQFTARLAVAPYRGNSVFARAGNVAADANGRVYLTGKAASGLPLTIDYQPGEYTGGAYVLILSADMSKREMVIRLTNGDGRTIAVQNKDRWLYAGSTALPLYAASPLQATPNIGSDAFLAVVDNFNCPLYNGACAIIMGFKVR